MYVQGAIINMTSSIVQSNVADLGGGGFFENSGSWIMFSSLQSNEVWLCVPLLPPMEWTFWFLLYLVEIP